MLQLLLSYTREINVEVVTPWGATPLLECCDSGIDFRSMQIAKALLKAKADVNQGTNENVTCLMVAAKHGDLGLVKLLVRQGAWLCTERCQEKCDKIWHGGIRNRDREGVLDMCGGKGIHEYLLRLGVK